MKRKLFTKIFTPNDYLRILDIFETFFRFQIGIFLYILPKNRFYKTFCFFSISDFNDPEVTNQK